MKQNDLTSERTTTPADNEPYALTQPRSENRFQAFKGFTPHPQRISAFRFFFH